MKIIITVEVPSDASLADLVIRPWSPKPEETRVALWIDGKLEINVNRDELINALMALDGNYSINALRRTAYNRDW